MVKIFLKRFENNPWFCSTWIFWVCVDSIDTPNASILSHTKTHKQKKGWKLDFCAMKHSNLKSFYLGRYPYSTTFQNLLSDFEAPNCPNNIPEDSRRLAKGLGRILKCGGWCVGARNRAWCTWEHAEFNTWPKSLLGSTNAQKTRIQLVMSIGNIYI